MNSRMGKPEKKKNGFIAIVVVVVIALFALCWYLVKANNHSEESPKEGTETMPEQTEDTVEVIDWYEQMLEVSVISTGTNGRLEKVLNKMKQGEDVTIAFLGGSVTEGAGANNYKESYADVSVDKLKELYPKSNISYTNAGLGGTSSALGIMRYERDILGATEQQPDILVLEFAVNDYQEPTDARAYESLIRTVLKGENAPAVILLFSVFQSKWNMQDKYIPLGEWYGLPMVSIKNAIVQPYKEEQITDKQFFSDEYHPTSYGHSVMADCLIEMINQAVGNQSGVGIDAVPMETLKTAEFVGTKLLTAIDTKDAKVVVGSFSGTDTAVQAFGRTGKSSFSDNWMHEKESGNKALHIELTCRNILLNYKTSSSDEYGRALVYLDGEQVAELNGYSEGGWNNSNVVLVLDETANEHHELEIRMAEGDENKKFTVLAIGYSSFEPDGLVKVYEDNFPIGVALPNTILNKSNAYEGVLLNNFNSITCENEMKPDALLDQVASKEALKKTKTHAAVKFNNCKPAIKFALEHGMKIRLHTLVWHSQTPKWFFTEDYTDGGKLVDRETMLLRMENYIADVLGYFEENYPGLIYAVDVVNEAFDVGNGDDNGIRMKENLWYQTVGSDYYYQAFVYAKKYASEDMKLFYNDYGCMDKKALILKNLEQVKAEGLIDGIGMQSHLSTDDSIQYKFMLAVKEFCNAGYEVQITELDIGVKEETDAAFLVQARKYRSFFKNLKQLQEEGYPITGITIWGIDDAHSWRNGEYGLLFDKDMNPKKAYYGAMLDASIPDVE